MTLLALSQAFLDYTRRHPRALAIISSGSAAEAALSDIPRLGRSGWIAKVSYRDQTGAVRVFERSLSNRARDSLSAMPSPVKVTVFYDELQPPEVIHDIDRGWSESLHSPSQSSGAALFTFFCFTFMSVIATHFWRTRARS